LCHDDSLGQDLARGGGLGLKQRGPRLAKKKKPFRQWEDVFEPTGAKWGWGAASWFMDGGPEWNLGSREKGVHSGGLELGTGDSIVHEGGGSGEVGLMRNMGDLRHVNEGKTESKRRGEEGRNIPKGRGGLANGEGPRRRLWACLCLPTTQC